MLQHIEIINANLVFLPFSLYNHCNPSISMHLDALVLVSAQVLHLCLKEWFWVRQATPLVSVFL